MQELPMTGPSRLHPGAKHPTVSGGNAEPSSTGQFSQSDQRLLRRARSSLSRGHSFVHSFIQHSFHKAPLTSVGTISSFSPELLRCHDSGVEIRGKWAASSVFHSLKSPPTECPPTFLSEVDDDADENHQEDSLLLSATWLCVCSH